jgi:serine/threonine-protein kinase
MAEVFEATASGERGFERAVAVKRMLPEIGRIHDDGFLDEARIASRLHHANIVAVLDYGIADGLPFQVLELVEGLDLQSALDLGRPLSPELALQVCVEVTYALSHAHEALGSDGQPLGIVHRDVKPANILVSYDGDVKLGDFGIAFARNRLQQTEAGIAKGTREFMSPEQWMGGAVDGRSDVFSLGCVLYALLTGTSPMGQTRAEELLEGSELKFDQVLPVDLAPIIERATRRQKRDRYPTVAEMGEALGAALQRRVAEPPKQLLQKWMRELRPLASTRPSESVDLELARDEKKGERQFLTEIPKGSRRGLALVGGAAALLCAGLVGVAMWPRPTPPAVQTPVAIVHDTPDLAVSMPKAEPPTPPPIVAKPKRAHPRPQTPATPVEPVVPAPRPIAPPNTSTGHLLVGGQGALRAEIWIDGNARGFAPKLLELPTGEHEVELSLGNGSHLKKRVVLAESNTPSSPLRWMVP